MDCSVEELKKLTNEIIYTFSQNACENNNKWTLLNSYHNKYLLRKNFDKSFIASYISVLSTLIDSLQPSLFCEKWQEIAFDNVFFHGILHESLLILVKGLDRSEEYVKQKILNLLQKFIQKPFLESLFIYQCMSSRNWNLKYVSKSNVWDHLITVIVSLPDRIANKTKGKNVKVFCPTYYVPLLLSAILKVLHSIYESLKSSQDCSVEFLAKLTGRICLLGKADIVAKMYLKEILNLPECDYIWKRILQNFISKMPSNSVDSFITNLLLQIPWYGYVEWILGDEGIKNEKVNYIMTVKLLFFRSFKNVIILQNSIGYFASSTDRVSDFIKILDSLLDSWTDERSLRYQNAEQKIYIASAFMICAGWLKQLQIKLNNKDYINKVLKGTQIRLGCSEDTDQFIGMVIGSHLVQALDPDSPALEFECPPNVDLLNHLKDMLEIPSKPNDAVISFADMKCFEDIKIYNQSANISNENKISEENDKEVHSDDDLEPYDMSNDTPESRVKRPLYLRDCMMGLIQQDNVEWTEKCLRQAEELIKVNPYATEEVAEEMAKIMLHLTDNSSIADFVGLRHKILITLTVQCPLVVASYLTSQFTERDYTIRHRLDILEVLAASSALLSSSGPSQETCSLSSSEDFAKLEPDWQILLNHRLKAKTKWYTKTEKVLFRENKFSAIAGSFFYPLLNSFEKTSKILKLDDDDSYVLGRFIYTLGIIMCCASNTLHCSQMGTSLLQFLHSVKTHKDVFVRKSILFAVAAVYTAVPPSILFAEMLPDVTLMTDWLQSVAEKDFDVKCVEKAIYALSIFQSAASEGSLLYQLKNLTSSEKI